MLMIRFQRVGRTNDPAFRLVVTERRSKPKTSGIEQLGSYHPKTKETRLEADRILYWLGKGAKTSPRVHNLLISKGVIKGKKIDVAKSGPVRNPRFLNGAGPKETPQLETAEAEPKETADVSRVDPVRDKTP